MATLSSTLSYNQWIMPLAMQQGTNTYFAGVRSSDGDWYVQRQDSGGTITSQKIEEGIEDDDHNAPCILARPSKDIHVFFARHNASTVVNHFRASAGAAPSAFYDDGNINFASNVTYAQALDYNDDIYIFTRNGSEKWGFNCNIGS